MGAIPGVVVATVFVVLLCVVGGVCIGRAEGTEERFSLPARHALLNMTDTYKGTWSTEETAESQDAKPWPNGHKRFFLGRTQNYGTLGARIFASDFPNGDPRFSLLEGELIFREGEYLSDPTSVYAVAGILDKARGRVELLAVPFGIHNDWVQEEAFSNSTAPFLEMLQRGRSRRLGRLSDPDGQPLCPLLITMNAATDENGSKIVLEPSQSREGGTSGKGDDSASSRGGVGARVRKSPFKELVLDGSGVARSCMGMNLTVHMETIQISEYTRKTSRYSLLLTIITCLQIMVTIRQSEHTRSHSGAARVSVLSVGQQAVLDAYLCLFHLTSGILIDPVFNSFATAAFFKFVLFAIFEMRFLLTLWKAQNPLGADEDGRSQATKVYARFYACMLAGVFLAYNFSRILSLLTIVLYMFWVPQIARNVWRDAQRSLSPRYIITITLTRMFVPAYFLGCPENFFKIRPSVPLLLSIVAVLLLQMAVLLSQHYLGSRWFVPSWWLPEKFSYFRPEAYVGGASDMDCAICMHPLDPEEEMEGDVESAGVPVDGPAEARERQTRRRAQINSREIMCTPCRHVYHAECLRRWMEMKMECPTCRAQLPEE